MNQQLIDDLKAAKAELEKRGWNKGRLIAMDGTVCSLGAIGFATIPGYGESAHLYGPFHNDRRAQSVVQAVANAVVPNCDDPVGIIAGINDKLDTKVEDVYSLFDKALAEAGGLA